MVDILMATYNSGGYVREQIESILNQTAASWQLFIRDDCSNDGTFEILKEYENKYPERINVMKSDKNSGKADVNFFELLKNVRHGHIMFCDQDDVWEANKIEETERKMLEFEQAYSDVPILIHTDVKVVDEKLNVISNSMFKFQHLNKKADKLNNLVAQNIVTGCTMMVNKKLIDMIDEKPQHDIMHDWWMALIASCFGKIGFIEEPMSLYRQHCDNNVGAKNSLSISYNLGRMKNSQGAKRVLADTYVQAEEFLNTYSDKLSDKQIKILNKYIQIPQISKIKRITTLFKYGFLKFGIQRKLGQIIYI